VRRAAIMIVVIYLVVIGLRPQQFRKTPVGFIPQVDGGYIIVVVQLPPGASLARTDAVQQRALDIALQVPGVAHGVNVVGFSGATFTNAPNSGAIFLVLEPFEERAGIRAKSARPSRPSSIGGCPRFRKAF
jgi:multidrug efflux pump subunit AcrB